MELPEHEEKMLVNRMIDGDERAFDDFFDAYFPPLYRFALSRLGGDEDLAEEVVQRSLCKAVDHVASWRGEAQLLTWLCAICRNEVTSHFRKFNRAPLQVELTEDLPEVRAALDSLGTGVQDPEQQALLSELIDLVHVALDRVPPQYGRALEWKYLEGASVIEIAGRLGSTPKAVESMLSRARVAYRDALSSLLEGRNAVALRGGSV